jgi:hypothetical protein
MLWARNASSSQSERSPKYWTRRSTTPTAIAPSTRDGRHGACRSDVTATSQPAAEMADRDGGRGSLGQGTDSGARSGDQVSTPGGPWSSGWNRAFPSERCRRRSRASPPSRALGEWGKSIFTVVGTIHNKTYNLAANIGMAGTTSATQGDYARATQTNYLSSHALGLLFPEFDDVATPRAAT